MENRLCFSAQFTVRKLHFFFKSRFPSKYFCNLKGSLNPAHLSNCHICCHWAHFIMSSSLAAPLSFNHKPGFPQYFLRLWFTSCCRNQLICPYSEEKASQKLSLVNVLFLLTAMKSKTTAILMEWNLDIEWFSDL